MGNKIGNDIIPGNYQHTALIKGSKIQRFWHYSKLQLIEWLFPITSGMEILDIGCGSGVFADHMAGKGAAVLGIDANIDAISYATETFVKNGEKLTFLKGYLDEMNFENNRFDAITCLEVIEHVYPEQVRKMFGDVFHILKPNGRLLVTTPNYRGLWPVVEWVADNFAMTAKMDSDQHINHFDRSSLIYYLENAGFVIQKCRTYCTFAPFFSIISWKMAEKIENLERYVDIPFGNLLVMTAIKI